MADESEASCSRDSEGSNQEVAVQYTGTVCVIAVVTRSCVYCKAVNVSANGWVSATEGGNTVHLFTIVMMVVRLVKEADITRAVIMHDNGNTPTYPGCSEQPKTHDTQDGKASNVQAAGIDGIGYGVSVGSSVNGGADMSTRGGTGGGVTNVSV